MVTSYAPRTAGARPLVGFGTNETAHGIAEGMGLGHPHGAGHGGHHDSHHDSHHRRGPENAERECHRAPVHDSDAPRGDRTDVQGVAGTDSAAVDRERIILRLVLAITALLAVASVSGDGTGLFGSGWFMGPAWVWTLVPALLLVLVVLLFLRLRSGQTG